MSSLERIAVSALFVACVLLPACTRENPAPSARQEAEPPLAGPLELHVGKCSVTGNIREANEDAVAVADIAGATICLLADGMGGNVGDKVIGQIAATRAFDALKRDLAQGLVAAKSPDGTRSALQHALVAANADLIKFSRSSDDLQTAGTTIVVTLWRPEYGMCLAGIGDSRAYLIRGAAIQQLTVDHTLAQALVENKTITPEEAATHRFRNVLWKYLGSAEVGSTPEVRPVEVRAGDRILLSTDGLHGAVPNERLLDCMRQHADAEGCAAALCRRALDSGSRDNISCIVIDVAARK